jgi:hypothetical protein
VKKLIAFDLDDTLTITKRPVTREMVTLLVQLTDLYEVCVITGGTYNQVEEDLVRRLRASPGELAHLHFLPVNGGRYHYFDASKNKWALEHFAEDLNASVKVKISRALERIARRLGYWEPNPAGDIIQDRGSQVTFSALGQLATPEDKYAWDPSFVKRQTMLKAVSKALPDFQVSINGNTSLDVTPKGVDKGFGIEALRKRLGIERDEVLFIGDQLYEGGNDYPVKMLGIDTINVQNVQQTEFVIEGLIKKGHGKAGRPSVHGGLERLVGGLVTMQPLSRQDLNQQIKSLLKGCNLEVIDHHNTTSIMYKFSIDGKVYGLKVGYGANDAVRDEARWYELIPADLKLHHIMSHISSNHAFVLMRWLEQARTIEEIAIAGEETDGQDAMDLIIKALEQDMELFNSNPTVPLFTTRGHSFFLDKYHAYNSGAKQFPYLQELLDRKTVYINGKKYAGPYIYVQTVQKNDKLRNYLSPDRAGLIHGDANADNLLVQDGTVYMIDPKAADHLPLEYDTGRLCWSLTGWNAITRRGQFNLNKKGRGYELDVVIRRQYVDGLSRFRACLSEQDYHRAMYSAAMQYLTRVHHASNEPETTALYLRGLQVFDDLFTELNVKI